MATQTIRIQIPEGLDFADLNLHRDPVTLDVGFSWEPIEKICAASGIDLSFFREDQLENVGDLINHWYEAHLAFGGAPDIVQELLRAEVAAEMQTGGAVNVISHKGTLQ